MRVGQGLAEGSNLKQSAGVGCGLVWAGTSDRLGFLGGQVHLGESRGGCQRSTRQLDWAGPNLICASSEVNGEPSKGFTQGSGIIRFVF